jgi:hypothetical protein
VTPTSAPWVPERNDGAPSPPLARIERKLGPTMALRTRREPRAWDRTASRSQTPSPTAIAERMPRAACWSHKWDVACRAEIGPDLIERPGVSIVDLAHQSRKALSRHTQGTSRGDTPPSYHPAVPFRPPVIGPAVAAASAPRVQPPPAVANRVIQAAISTSGTRRLPGGLGSGRWSPRCRSRDH